MAISVETNLKLLEINLKSIGQKIVLIIDNIVPEPMKYLQVYKGCYMGSRASLHPILSILGTKMHRY